jgi:hypothetical protein
MNRRNMLITATAALAIGVAVAAQSTSTRADRHPRDAQLLDPWVPGANMVMSAHEANVEPPEPPR